MAELVYSEEGRLLFTEEMKKEYTILMPQMLPVHFSMMRKCMELEGFKVDMLTSNHRGIIDTGLKYVHNDTCYPALLVIGQLIEAVESGEYDPHKVALIITQTGGGCRASNYIHLLRKALQKAGLDFVPVISLNLSGLEKNPGFKLSLKFLIRMIYAIVYGDTIVQMANQCRPYEIEKGATDKLIEKWMDRLVEGFKHTRGLGAKGIKKNMQLIADDFAALPVKVVPKVKVGVVGEIYIKYSPLGNNNLEEFLLSEDCEPIVPGLIDFVAFKVDNRIEDIKLYGGNPVKLAVCQILIKFVLKQQKAMIDTIKTKERFRVPTPFLEIKKLVRGYLGYGNKMGEGWLLTGEMLELVEDGINNIVCAQPFGCLPNHVVGKGMIRAIKNNHPDSNIVSIDYDPGATKINQENRIKLMLANAKISKMKKHKPQTTKETANV